VSDTTAITDAQFKAALLRAAQAVEDSDYATARLNLVSAEIIAAGLPSSGSAAGIAASRRSDLDRLHQALLAAETRANMSSTRRVIGIKTGRTDHGG